MAHGAGPLTDAPRRAGTRWGAGFRRGPGFPRVVGAAAPALLPVAFLGVFFAWPVVAIVRLGFADGGVAATLLQGSTWELAGFTVAQAAAATVLAVLAGLPLAWLTARARLPGVTAVRTLVLVPFVLPTVVVGLAFRALWPDGGVATIVLANAFFNVAVVARTVGGLWSHLDRRVEDTARALGASRWRAFRSVTLPALWPAVSSAAAVVFLFCATSFGVVLMLGGTRYRTLETEIYLRTVNLLDLSGAAALSLVQMAAVVAALVVGARARRRRDAASAWRGDRTGARRPSGGEWWVVAAAGAVLMLLLVPIVALLARSVSGRDGWTAAGYRALAGFGGDDTVSVTGWEAAVNSLRTATDATLIALVVASCASVAVVTLGRSPHRGARVVGEVTDAALMVPLGVSAVTVGFGYLVTLGELPGQLRTSPLLVPLAQALVIIPLMVRLVLPVLRSVDGRLRQAAATLGAGPVRLWREIDLPLVARSFAAAAAFGYVVALGEFGATSFLSRPDAPTLPVLIADLVSRPGALNHLTAYAACALLMVVTVAMALVIESLRSPQARVGEF